HQEEPVLATWRYCLGRVVLFQAEDGIRDSSVTGVQTCALPIFARSLPEADREHVLIRERSAFAAGGESRRHPGGRPRGGSSHDEIGRASCRERVWIWGAAAAIKQEQDEGVD